MARCGLVREGGGVVSRVAGEREDEEEEEKRLVCLFAQTPHPVPKGLRERFTQLE
jgi:hypothetical protein